MSQIKIRVLAIDPGSAKCGVAVVEPGRTLHQEIILTAQLPDRIAKLRTQFSPTHIVLGDGTQSKHITALLPEAVLVAEAYTSQRARERLRKSRPWWQRFLPLTQPYDDIVAVILAEDWLKSRTHPPGPLPCPKEGTEKGEAENPP